MCTWRTITKDPAETTAPLIHRSTAGYAEGTQDDDKGVVLLLLGAAALTAPCHSSHWLTLLCIVACTHAKT